MLPPEEAASRRAFSASIDNRVCKKEATVSSAGGLNLTCRQRERIVAGKWEGLAVTSIKILAEGGSSNVFKRALAAASFILSASSMMQTRFFPSQGLNFMRS